MRKVTNKKYYFRDILNNDEKQLKFYMKGYFYPVFREKKERQKKKETLKSRGSQANTLVSGSRHIVCGQRDQTPYLEPHEQRQFPRALDTQYNPNNLRKFKKFILFYFKINMAIFLFKTQLDSILSNKYGQKPHFLMLKRCKIAKAILIRKQSPRCLHVLKQESSQSQVAHQVKPLNRLSNTTCTCQYTPSIIQHEKCK